MKRNLMLIVTALLLMLTVTSSALPAVRQSSDLVQLHLLLPGQYTQPGRSVTFMGALATTQGPVYVADITVSLNAPFTLVKGDFFSGPPRGRLLTGATATSRQFIINLSSETALGTYNGTATIIGGSNPDSRDILTTRSFQIIVMAEAPPPSRTQMFYDDFESGDDAQCTPVSGVWEVFNPPGGSLEYGASSATDEAVSLGGSDLIDYSVEAWVNVADNNNGGICLLGRVQDESHYYQLELKPDYDGTRKWWLWIRIGDDWKHLKSGPFDYSADTYYKLRLSMNLKQLSARYSTDGQNFTYLGDATDHDRIYVGGKIGLRRWGTAGTFDGVRVVMH